MFMFNGEFCAVKTWFHDLPANMTQATLYRYETEENYLEHNNELSSDIYKFNYSEELHSLEGIENAVKEFMEKTSEEIPE